MCGKKKQGIEDKIILSVFTQPLSSRSWHSASYKKPCLSLWTNLKCRNFVHNNFCLSQIAKRKEIHIEDEDQRRLDHNARLLLLLASLTKLLLSPIQPSSPFYQASNPPLQPLQEPSYRLSCHTYCPSYLLLASTLFTYKRDGPPLIFAHIKVLGL